MPKKKAVKKQANKVIKGALKSATPDRKQKAFPVVGMGASAGGLEAFEAFFKAMPENSGIAFVLVAHLDPTHASLLPELIQKHTKMPVVQITHNETIEPDKVYVIPPNNNLTVEQGVLKLSTITKPRGANQPIDYFFRSLASDQGDKAICIILSGTGSDGTLGLKAIKGENGMVMVQEQDSAKYDGMPRSAIATGLADYILKVEQLPQQLVIYCRHSFSSRTSPVTIGNEDQPPALMNIFTLLKIKTGHDFSQYKKNTIFRRIERRMNVHQIADMNEYLTFLRDSEREVKILFKELLIGVTNFFRDPDAFDALKTHYLPDLLSNKPDDYTVRVWVNGCSTGEEAYSLAILLQEYLILNNLHFNVQVFGTDLDEEAISFARAGFYPKSIQADVSPERLKNFFTEEDDGQYRIKKVIREMIVFAPQNIIQDPPFTKLDILSCRNLLIYLGAELQRKLLPVFHYSLKPEGILFLGPSESIGPATDLFDTLDKKWRFFRKTVDDMTYRPVMNFPSSSISVDEADFDIADNIKQVEEVSALQLVETILHQSKTPPCAIIDDKNNIVYIHGRTGLFLEPAEGKITYNILEMARPGLKAALSSSIRKVATHKQDVITRDLKLEYQNGQIFLDLYVKPIHELPLMRGLMMVIFNEKKGSSRNDNKITELKPEETAAHTSRDLERELIHTRENLQSTIEELETSNEELKSANEELQSTNEELQSTNEEMETSKEELQSLNEESITVNSELQSRMDSLSKSNDDMKNLLDSTNIATIFLDLDLCIRRFTPRATDIFSLTAQDIGRPIHHFASTLIDADTTSLGSSVLRDLIPVEKEVVTYDDKVFVLKIRPYRTITNVIDGLVFTFEDISQRKLTELALQESEAQFRMLFELSNDGMMLIDSKSGDFIKFNDNAHSRLGYTREEFLSLNLFRIEHNAAHTKDIVLSDLKEQGCATYFTQYHCKNGDVMDVEVKANSVHLNDNEFLLTVWTEAFRQVMK